MRIARTPRRKLRSAVPFVTLIFTRLGAGKPVNQPERPAFFYGWVIVGFTFVTQFVVVGLSYYTFSVYLKPLTEALETERFMISLAMLLQSLMSAFLSPLAGKLFAEKSVMMLMFIGTAFLSTGLILLSQITATWQLLVLFGGFVGVGMVFLGAIPCNMLLANWFHARRGTALGISQFGLTISGTILIPAVTAMIETFGWRTTFMLSGIAAAVVMLPLIRLFAVRAPADRGLYPDGASAPPPQANNFPGDAWTFWRAFSHRDIWCITLIVGPCYLGIGSVILGMHSYITDIGISAMEASGVVALTTLFGAFAKPIFGILSDHLAKKLVVALAIGLQAVGVGLLIAAGSLVGLYAAGVCFGLGYGAISPLWAVLLATRFGPDAFTRVMGANMPMLMPFNMVGLPITTAVFGLTGSYVPAFMGLIAVYVVAAVALALLRLDAPAAELEPELERA